MVGGEFCWVILGKISRRALFVVNRDFAISEILFGDTLSYLSISVFIKLGSFSFELLNISKGVLPIMFQPPGQEQSEIARAE